MPDRVLRPSALDYARPAAHRQATNRATVGRAGVAGSTVIGVLHRFASVDVDTTDTEVTITEVDRAEVTVHGGRAWLPANPGTYITGGPVIIQVDADRTPRRVLAAAHQPRSEAEEEKRVTHLPGLVLDEVARQRAAEAWQGLQDAQQDLTAARDRLDTTDSRLDEAGGFIDQLRQVVFSAAVHETYPPDRPGTSPGATWVQRDANGDVVGRWEWVGLPTTPIVDSTNGEQYATMEALGGGWVRFVATIHAPHDWSVASQQEVSFGPLLDWEFDAPGDYWVRVTDGNGYIWQQQVTITQAMMDPYTPPDGWETASQAVNIEHLTQTGGPLDPDVVAALWEQVVAAGFLVATEAIIGPEAIIDGTIEARHITATEAIIGPTAIIDGAIETRHLNVVPDDPSDGGTSILPDGVRVWQAGDDPDTPSVSFTVGGDHNVLVMADGAAVAGLGSYGIQGTTVAATEQLLYQGRPITEHRPWGVAWGIVAYGYSLDARTITNGERALMELTFDAVAGRAYTVHLEPIAVASQIKDLDEVRVRTTEDGSRPNLYSTLWRRVPLRQSDTGADEVTPVTVNLLWDRAPGTPGTEFTKRFLLSYRAEQQAGIAATGQPFRMWVEDKGPAVPDTAVVRTDSSETALGQPEGEPTTPTPPAERREYTRTYYATSVTSFQYGGTSVITAGAGANGEPVQGYHPDAGAYGQKMTHYYFDYNQIMSDLSGAEQITADFYLFANHWRGQSGTARVHTHDYAAGRSTYGSPVFLGDVKLGRGDGRWVGVGGDEWRTGAIKGIALSARGSQSGEYYGRFAKTNDSHADRRPRLQITYYK